MEGFELRVSFPLGDDFREQDQRLIDLVGRRPDFSGASASQRDAGWRMASFAHAISLRGKLQAAGFLASVRET